MKLLVLFTILFANTVIAQDNRIAQFAVWQPYPGQEVNFQLGYKRHLQWRKTTRESWEWHGWQIASGPRAGQFINATFDHYWSDFDRIPSPNEDMADKLLNIVPYAELQSVYKITFLKSPLSIGTPQSLKSKSAILRMITLKVSDIGTGVQLISRLRASYANNSDISYLLSFKKIDGGEINELMLLLGFETWDLYGKSENIQEQITSIENGLKVKIIQSIRSETLVLRPDLSLFSGDENISKSIDPKYHSADKSRR